MRLKFILWYLMTDRGMQQKTRENCEKCARSATHPPFSHLINLFFFLRSLKKVKHCSLGMMHHSKISGGGFFFCCVTFLLKSTLVTLFCVP